MTRIESESATEFRDSAFGPKSGRGAPAGERARAGFGSAGSFGPYEFGAGASE